MKNKCLFIDNYDSFSHTILYYLHLSGFDTHIIKNNFSFKKINYNNFDCFVFSPGPGNILNTGNSLEIFSKVKNKFPVLGICLGHQLICHFFGGKINHLTSPFHGINVPLIHKNDRIFNNIPRKFSMACYNSLIIEELNNKNIEIIARTEKDNHIMGVKIKDKKIYGLQFHPESFMSMGGKYIFENFLKIIND
ncbi:MAG: anthranilate synthase component II [Candidatus Muiribacteriota bacterium]